MTTAEKIRKELKSRGISLGELAAKVGWSETTRWRKMKFDRFTDADLANIVAVMNDSQQAPPLTVRDLAGDQSLPDELIINGELFRKVKD